MKRYILAARAAKRARLTREVAERALVESVEEVAFRERWTQDAADRAVAEIREAIEEVYGEKHAE